MTVRAKLNMAVDVDQAWDPKWIKLICTRTFLANWNWRCLLYVLVKFNMIGKLETCESSNT